MDFTNTRNVGGLILLKNFETDVYLTCYAEVEFDHHGCLINTWCYAMNTGTTIFSVAAAAEAMLQQQHVGAILCFEAAAAMLQQQLWEVLCFTAAAAAARGNPLFTAAAAAAAHLVAGTAEALLNHHVIHRLVIYTEYEGRAILLVVGLLAVRQTRQVLETAWGTYKRYKG